MWASVISDILECHDYSQARIAREVDISKEAISKLVRGTTREPKYGTGANLLALHMRLRPDRYQTVQHVFQQFAKGLPRPTPAAFIHQALTVRAENSQPGPAHDS